MTIEIRAGLPAEVRAESDGVKVAGHAAVFNERANIGGYFEEVVAPGAFSEALERGDDVVFLVNHDGLPLARTGSGTLKLKEDKRGLHMATELNSADPDVQALVPKMERGDLDKMSFAFIVEREEWDETGDIPVRTIQQVRLRDVSIVTTPAYGGTDIALRSMQDAMAALKSSHRNLDQIARRIRRMEAELRNRTA